MSSLTFDKSSECFEQGKNYMPLGVNSPGRLFGDVQMPPLVAHKAKGAILEDVDGNRYVDFVMGLGPCILGHSPEPVNEALREQIQRGTVYGMNNALEVELARRIVDACDGVDKIRFTCSGTEAVMTAMRVARAHTGKPAILKFKGGYHGHSDTALTQASKSSVRNKNSHVADGIQHAVSQCTLVSDYNDVDMATETITQNAERLAAVILEPVATNMGLVLPSKEFLSTLRNLCDDHNILLIFDEVVTGFRFTFGSVSKLLGIQPDLITFGKIIGGGLAIGAYCGPEHIMSEVGHNGGVFQGGTFAGNPLTMAAGVATLDVLSESGFYDDLSRLSSRFAELTREGFQRENIGFSIKNFGALASYIFVEGCDELRSFSDVLKQDNKLFSMFHLKMAERGYLFPPTIEEPIFFSSAHTMEQVEGAASAGVEVLYELMSGGA
ncbi:aspartate aminotransferase family protein [Aestuariispira ectoiniformans]|uniref:aspartate aminotransferase family protein n=1 Tax=Aestuariispira ectoiniformans TaxID=2775080 RepID=UPI00223B05D1|nr:glutamate-1-semialdehyde 2,1-aminomutase [Aestuariispira ectoiniformans]